MTGDKRRLLDAFAGRAAAIPFFEEVIERRPAQAILGRAVAGDTRQMAVEDYVELAQRLGLDAVVAHTGGWLGGGTYAEASDGSRHYVGGSARVGEELAAEPFDPGEAREAVRRYVEAAGGTGVGVMAWLPGIITGPAIALGYEAFALALHDAPALLEQACDLQLARTSQALATAVEAGADFVAMGDDISDRNGPMMAPDMLRRLWLERAKAITAEARRRSVSVMLHCCGHLGAVLPLAIEAGFDTLQPVAGCNDVPAILAQARGRIAVAGTVDVGSVLVRGTPQAVRETVREHWRAYGPKGFVIGSNHSLNDAVPGANTRALAEAVAELRGG